MTLPPEIAAALRKIGAGFNENEIRAEGHDFGSWEAGFAAAVTAITPLLASLCADAAIGRATDAAVAVLPRGGELRVWRASEDSVYVLMENAETQVIHPDECDALHLALLPQEAARAAAGSPR